MRRVTTQAVAHGDVAGDGAVDLKAVRLALPPLNDHPAAFSVELYAVLIELIRGCGSVLDPFAGTGRIHQIAEMAGVPISVGVELEREWSNWEMYQRGPRRQIIGDSLVVVPGLRRQFGAVLTSPVYANRMSDHHHAKDPCKKCVGTGLRTSPAGLVLNCQGCRGSGLSRRNTYTHRLGRPLSTNSAAGMQWGEPYRELHRAAWSVCAAKLTPGGRFVVNVSNHIRKHVEIDVIGWHSEVLAEVGLEFVERIDVSTRRQKHGANADKRTGSEAVLVFAAPAS